MTPEKLEEFVAQAIQRHLTATIIITAIRPAHGGMINHCYHVETSEGLYFIKWNNDPKCSDLFEQEALGLKELIKSPITTPRVLGFGEISQKYYLILEHFEPGAPQHDFFINFGHQLAKQHQILQDTFGWSANNHIGKLPQSNDYRSNWTMFFIECRLIPQLNLAIQSGLISKDVMRSFENLFPKLEHSFPDEPPSLLHGDLWSGNFMIGLSGDPVIFDPAVYYGNREIEIAFTRLFGGFDEKFYDSYNDSFALAPGFGERAELYNLYPLLVHLNLFGTSYLSGIIQILRKFT